MKGLTISQAAKACNVHIETVRYYERRGLIQQPLRNESGYRMYDQEAIEDIQFIKSAQAIGFTLEEIKVLQSMKKEKDFVPTEEMYEMALAKVQQIEQKMSQLHHLKSLLVRVTKGPLPAHVLPKEQCPVIQTVLKESVERGNH